MRPQINHRPIQTHWSLAAAAALLAFSAAANSRAATSSMTIEEFVKLPSFEGRIAKLEEGNSEHPRSVSGPDFRITVRKQGGSEIVIDRMPTMFGGADRLRTLAKHKRCELPSDIDLCWDDNSQWGETVNGLRLGIRLEPYNRQEFHPGELFSIVVKYQFDPANKPRKLPLEGIENCTQIHLETPAGREFIYDPFQDYQHGIDPTDAVPDNQWTDYQGLSTERFTIRLSDSKNVWVDAKTKKPAELRLGNEESFYRIWAECHVVAGKKAPRNAWRGDVRSGESVFPKVINLPDAKRSTKLTGVQRQLVDKWLARPKTDASVPAWPSPLETTLGDILSLTENEALAQRLVEIVKTDPKNAADAFRLLTVRSGTMSDGHAGIDGPYLKELSNYLLDVIEGKHVPPEGERSTKLFGVSQIVVYVNEHPEDHEMHDRAVDAIKKLCRSIADQKALFQQQRPSDILYYSAWPALQRLGQLKPGMTKEEAIDLLGKPAHEDANSIQWIALHPGYENPNGGQLTAEMKNGKVSKWQRKPE